MSATEVKSREPFDLSGERDPQVWAQKFLGVFDGWVVGGGVDEGVMIGWFANAMQTMEGSKPPDVEGGTAPRIYDPGAEGWLEDPKVSRSELLLYGDLAPTVRRAGEAAVAAQEAYHYACKHAPPEGSEIHTRVQHETYEAVIRDTWRVYENLRILHRQVAEYAVTLMRTYDPPRYSFGEHGR